MSWPTQLLGGEPIVPNSACTREEASVMTLAESCMWAIIVHAYSSSQNPNRLFFGIEVLQRGCRSDEAYGAGGATHAATWH